MSSRVLVFVILFLVGFVIISDDFVSARRQEKIDGNWSRIEYDNSFYKGQLFNLTMFNYGEIIDEDSLYYDENQSIFLTAYSVFIDGEQEADMYLSYYEAYKPKEWGTLRFQTKDLAEGIHIIKVMLIGTVYKTNTSAFNSSIPIPNDLFEFGFELLVEIELDELITLIFIFTTPVIWGLYYNVHTKKLKKTYKNYGYFNAWPLLFSAKRLPFTVPLLLATGYAYLNQFFSPVIDYISSSGSYYLNSKLPQITGLEPEWIQIIMFATLIFTLIPMILSFIPEPDQVFGKAKITPLKKHKLEYKKRRAEALKEFRKDEKKRLKHEQKELKQQKKEKKKKKR